jgi:hypothetical protein
MSMGQREMVETNNILVKDLEETICDLRIGQRLNGIERTVEHIAEAQMAIVNYLDIHFKSEIDKIGGFTNKTNREGMLIAVRNNFNKKK